MKLVSGLLKTDRFFLWLSFATLPYYFRSIKKINVLQTRIEQFMKRIKREKSRSQKRNLPFSSAWRKHTFTAEIRFGRSRLLVPTGTTTLPAHRFILIIFFMKSLLDFSLNALPWVMVILAGLAFITMVTMLYNQKQHHQKLNKKS